MVIYTDKGDLEWISDIEKSEDVVLFNSSKKSFPKTRRDDFRPEINLIENMLNGLVVDAPIALEKMKKVSTLSKLAFEKIKR